MLRFIVEALAKTARFFLSHAFLRRAALYGLLAALLAVIGLAVFVGFYPVWEMDVEFSRELQEEAQPYLTQAMTLVSMMGNDIFVLAQVAIFFALFLISANVKEALFLLTVFPAAAVNYLLKIIINRPRPEEGIVQILQEAVHSSFPSGHTTHYTFFYGFLIVAMWNAKRLPASIRWVTIGMGLILISTIGMSRIYLGVHWLTDIMAGHLVGMILLAIVLFFYFRQPKNYMNGL